MSRLQRRIQWAAAALMIAAAMAMPERARAAPILYECNNFGVSYCQAVNHANETCEGYEAPSGYISCFDEQGTIQIACGEDGELESMGSFGCDFFLEHHFGEDGRCPVYYCY